MSLVRRLGPLAALAVLLILPFSTLTIPGVFDGPLNSPGTLQLLASVGSAVATVRLHVRPYGMLVRARAAFRSRRLLTILVNAWVAAVAGGAGCDRGHDVAALLSLVALRTTNIARHGDARLPRSARSRGPPWSLTGGDEGLGRRREPAVLFGWCGQHGESVLDRAGLRRSRWWPCDHPGTCRPGARRDPTMTGGSRGRSDLYRFGCSPVPAAMAAGAGWLTRCSSGRVARRRASNLTLSLLVMVVLGGRGRSGDR
jgi:branched-chain amino acid transport system permease protein